MASSRSGLALVRLSRVRGHDGTSLAPKESEFNRPERDIKQDRGFGLSSLFFNRFTDDGAIGSGVRLETFAWVSFCRMLYTGAVADIELAAMIGAGDGIAIQLAVVMQRKAAVRALIAEGENFSSDLSEENRAAVQ